MICSNGNTRPFAHIVSKVAWSSCRRTIATLRSYSLRSLVYISSPLAVNKPSAAPNRHAADSKRQIRLSFNSFTQFDFYIDNVAFWARYC
jgi:hypothetical protein